MPEKCLLLPVQERERLSRMALVQTDKLAEGMVLASDKHDRNGRLLLTSGTELSSRHIRMLMTWGVSHIDIIDSHLNSIDETEETQIDTAALKKAEDELRLYFRHNDMSHPIIAELFIICSRRKALNE
jgi:hypothetical protein